MIPLYSRFQAWIIPGSHRVVSSSRRTAAASSAIAAPTFIPGRVLGSREHARAQRADHHWRHRRRRAGSPAHGSGSRAGGRIVAVADCYLKRATDAANERQAPSGPFIKTIAICSIGKARRRDRRHARSRPHAALHSRRAGRAGCVRREAADRVHPRRPNSGRRTFARTSESFKSARSSARWRSTASAVNSSATERSARLKRSAVSTTPAREPLRRPARRASARRRRLEHLVRPHRASPVQQSTAVWLDAMARLLRRRDDQLGCTRHRPNSMGPRQRRHRPDRVVARRSGPMASSP